MLHCDYYGSPENPPLLMLCGAGALDTFCMQYFLREKYYLTVPHLPGAGVNAGQEYNMQETVDGLLQLAEKLTDKKIAVMGHSMGAQLAAAAIFTRPEKFSCGILLSPWLIPDKKSISLYTAAAGITSAMFKWKWLVKLQGKYWNMTEEQSEYMAEYSRHITPAVFTSFFTQTGNLEDYPEYKNITVPVLALRGKGETKLIKQTVMKLGENKHFTASILPGCSHDFPMRKYKLVNPVITDFLDKNIE